MKILDDPAVSKFGHLVDRDLLIYIMISMYVVGIAMPRLNA
jgi:hypothetical protein